MLDCGMENNSIPVVLVISHLPQVASKQCGEEKRNDVMYRCQENGKPPVALMTMCCVLGRLLMLGLYTANNLEKAIFSYFVVNST